MGGPPSSSLSAVPNAKPAIWLLSPILTLSFGGKENICMLSIILHLLGTHLWPSKWSNPGNGSCTVGENMVAFAEQCAVYV